MDCRTIGTPLQQTSYVGHDSCVSFALLMIDGKASRLSKCRRTDFNGWGAGGFPWHGVVSGTTHVRYISPGGRSRAFLAGMARIVKMQILQLAIRPSEEVSADTGKFKRECN